MFDVNYANYAVSQTVTGLLLDEAAVTEALIRRNLAEADDDDDDDDDDEVRTESFTDELKQTIRDAVDVVVTNKKVSTEAAVTFIEKLTSELAAAGELPQLGEEVSEDEAEEWLAAAGEIGFIEQLHTLTVVN